MNDVIKANEDEKEELIKNMIYIIRGKQVMLDSDLARLYECANGTKSINLAVKRNIERFPQNFMFQLTEEEASRFQRETLNKSNNKRGYNIKYLPYVFTEQGVAMLSSVIKTPIAIKMSILIINTFVAMRHLILDNKELYLNTININNKLDNINNKLVDQDEKMLIYDKKFLKYDKQIKQLFSKFDKNEKKECIYFNGSIYDAYSKIVDIMTKAKKN